MGRRIPRSRLPDGIYVCAPNERAGIDFAGGGTYILRNTDKESKD